MWHFLVDEDMPRSTARVLRDASYQADDVRDVGLRGATDQQIYEYAQSQSAIIVTADKDFSNILRFPPGTHHDIVVLRVPNTLSIQQLNKTLLHALKELETETLEGTLVIVTADSVRVRRGG